MTKKYPSKISYGLLVFIFLIFFLPIGFIVINDEINIKGIGTMLFLLILFVFILHMFLKTDYTISNNELRIKCGFFSYKPIKIADIIEISKTKSLLSSPAPSFDRIKIKYGKFDFIIISPKNKFYFAKDLVKINSKIKNNISEK